MASSNVFTSYTSIQTWFSNKIALIQSQLDAFEPCANCFPASQKCPSCLRKLDILHQDINHFKFMTAREISIFLGAGVNGQPYDLNDMLKVYGEEKAKIRKQIEEWESAAGNEDVQGNLRKLREKLEDLERGEDREVEVAKCKGWY
jgi:hypothetical protein